MVDSTLSTFASVAGVAGIGLGVVLTIFKHTIQSGVLRRLPEEKAYRILRLVIVMTFLTGIVGVAAWLLEAYIKKPDPPRPREESFSSSLSAMDRNRAISLAGKGCFFYKDDAQKQTITDGDVRFAQDLYIRDLRGGGKGYKFLTYYDDVEGMGKGALDALRYHARIYYLADMLDISNEGPIESSKFIASSGRVGDYKCLVRVVSVDYKGEDSK